LEVEVEVKGADSTPIRVVGVLENPNIDSNTTVRVFKLGWFSFALSGERSVPFTCSFFLDTDLFDGYAVGNFTVDGDVIGMSTSFETESERTV
jgi:hypothetical protein